MAIKNLGNAGELFPQSVFIVATYDEQGVANAMNVAWGGECERHEVCINIGSHQTLDNIIAKRAFTVSPADKAHVVEADYFGIATGRKVNKAEKSGLTFTKSEFVDAPVIEEFPLTIECEVTEVQGDASGARGGQDRQHPHERGNPGRRGPRGLRQVPAHLLRLHPPRVSRD